MSSSDFRIVWTVPEAEWARSRDKLAEHPPGSDYDRHGRACYVLFNGEVDLVAGSTRMFPGEGPTGFFVSVLDVATQLAHLLNEGCFWTQGTVKFDQGDDDRQITFGVEESLVTARASDPGATELLVPRIAFGEGVVEFIASFTSALRAHVPDALERETTKHLKVALARYGQAARPPGLA